MSHSLARQKIGLFRIQAITRWLGYCCWAAHHTGARTRVSQERETMKRVVGFMMGTALLGTVGCTATDALLEAPEGQAAADTQPKVDCATTGTVPLNLSKCKGKSSFMAVMLARGGIRDLINADGAQALQLPTVDLLVKNEKIFDPGVKTAVLGGFARGQDGLNQLVNALEDQLSTNNVITTLNIYDKIKGLLGNPIAIKGPVNRVAEVAAPFISVASGAGAKVILDDQHAYLNVGYRTGSNPQTDPKTGRSYGVPSDRGARDASDEYFLDHLETFYQQHPEERAAFVRLILTTLTKSDVTGLSQLSQAGGDEFTDFMAIYTAEEDRHAMLNFKSHPWDRDLAEATWASLFVVQTKQSIKKGDRTPTGNGRPRDFYARGSSGSGIGDARHERQLLTTAIAHSLRNTPEYDKLATALHLDGSEHQLDLLQELTALLCSPGKDGANIELVQQHAQEIVDAGTAYITKLGAVNPESLVFNFGNEDAGNSDRANRRARPRPRGRLTAGRTSR
jgi:hypothetical protein